MHDVVLVAVGHCEDLDGPRELRLAVHPLPSDDDGELGVGHLDGLDGGVRCAVLLRDGLRVERLLGAISDDGVVEPAGSLASGHHVLERDRERLTLLD